MPTLYVNAATGDDSRSYATAQNSSTPWASIGRAAWGSTTRSSPNSGAAAAAGDTVVIAAGTYSANSLTSVGGSDARWDVLYNPVNEGTSGNLITFEANGTVAIQATIWNGPVIGSNSRDYIRWLGPFSLDEAVIDTAPDTGTCILLGVTGCVVDGVQIDGDGGQWDGDNHNGVRIENSTNCTVRNCTMHHIQEASSTGEHDATGVMLYNSDGALIEHNHVYECGSAFFIKGNAIDTSPNVGTIVRYNLVEDCYVEGIIGSYSQDGRYYGNVIANAPVGIYVFGEGSDAYEHPNGDWWFNNTVIGSSQAAVMVQGFAVCENVRVWNNILADSAIALYNEGATHADETRVSFEHNCYFDVTTFYAGSDGSRNFASYLAAFTDQDDDSVASINDDPDFVDAAAGDYHLQGGSPARVIGYAMYGVGGSDGTTIPAGCYITGDEVIGPGGEEEPEPPGESVQAGSTAVLVAVF